MLHVVSSSVIELLETIASTTCRGSGVSFDWASIMCRTVTRNDAQQWLRRWPQVLQPGHRQADVRPGLWLHVGVFPPGHAVAHRHRAVVASHRERVQHRCRIEAELSVQGEVHVLPDRPAAVLVKRLEDHLQQAQLVLRQLLTQHPVHAADTSQSTSPKPK